MTYAAATLACARGVGTSQWLRFAAGPPSSLPSSAGRPPAAAQPSLGSASVGIGESSHARDALSRFDARPPRDGAGVAGVAA